MVPAMGEVSAVSSLNSKNGSLPFGRFPATTVWSNRLLPAHGEDGLRLLRLLIDRSIPHEACLLDE
jgi:hypothetical protein